ncbi:carbohydrate kinase [Agreia pratensis]|uniref:carbohydrate kinase family protein n=1 Tax=Microbacteriaceae TaxID=85023 RepID=UPI00188B4E22|nr:MULTISPECIES: carbohydrate kinase [Microbacteriaceae]MBF4561230.1 carbohydrate kinase [Microbacterium sp. VKM Ac-2870]MBF4633881.1 carbohydrate kinase [Agreia pratensis]
MSRVLVVGESLIDVIDDRTETRGLPGGSPMNVAVGAARLGQAVVLNTAIGSDRWGRRLARHLSKSGVVLTESSFRDGPTSTATARIQEDGSALYSFNLQWALTGSALPSADILHFGSIAAFVEPGASTLLQSLESVSSIVTFDPNIRPEIYASAAAARSRFLECARLSSIVKLSDEDAKWLYPNLSADEAISQILKLGPGLVILTCGAQGALFQTGFDKVSIPTPRLDVVDTIGAGDAFMSGLIHKLAELLDAGVPLVEVRDGSAFTKERLIEIGHFAVLCSSIVVMRGGANPPTLDEVVLAITREESANQNEKIDAS